MIAEERRGQAEIVGLMLIVVLLAVGFLLYIKFSLAPDQQANAYQNYASTQLDQTFLVSLLSTDAMCGGLRYSVSDLVAAVATGNERCDAETALNDTLTTVLNRTLDPWGINYRLVFLKKTGDSSQGIGLEEYVNQDYPPVAQCTAEKDHTVQSFPVSIASGLGTVEAQLWQC